MSSVASSGIGLLNEKPLHASLKRWYARPGDLLEVPVDGFVIDIVRGDLLVEIQTGNVASLSAKLTTLLRSHDVRLVFPIAQEKWIVRPATEGSRGAVRRRSPKRGRLHDLFREMVGIAHLLSHPRFSLEVLLTREEEERRYGGKRFWRRKGWVIEERRLLAVLAGHLLEGPGDWRALLPVSLESFTTRELAAALGCERDLAQRMAYCLRKASVIESTGKLGREIVYRATRV